MPCALITIPLPSGIRAAEGSPNTGWLFTHSLLHHQLWGRFDKFVNIEYGTKMNERTEHSLLLRINGRQLNRVLIDQHYKEKHPEVTDSIILQLVEQLDGGTYVIDKKEGEFQYFRVEPVFHGNEPYRVVLVLCISDDYLGVINAFRVRRKK